MLLVFLALSPRGYLDFFFMNKTFHQNQTNPKTTYNNYKPYQRVKHASQKPSKTKTIRKNKYIQSCKVRSKLRGTISAKFATNTLHNSTEK
jgi:hypothetical protein